MELELPGRYGMITLGFLHTTLKKPPISVNYASLEVENQELTSLKKTVFISAQVM